MYLYEKQWTKLNSLPPLRSKTHGSLSLSQTFDVTNILSHTGLVYICSETFVCSSSISLSKAGTNEAGRLSLSWGGAIQTAPSRTLWCYFNVGSCNCVEQACFFSSRSNRGQSPLQPSYPLPASRGGPGLRPVWSSTCWENFTQETLLDSLRPVGSGARGRCVLKSTTQNQGSLCAWEFFYVCFWSWPLAGQQYSITFRIATLVKSTIELVFLHFFFPHCWKWTGLATSEHLWVSEWLFTA